MVLLFEDRVRINPRSGDAVTIDVGLPNMFFEREDVIELIGVLMKTCNIPLKDLEQE